MESENKFLRSIGCPFKEGDRLTGRIGDEYIDEIKLHVENGQVYLCQNERNGCNCKDKQGYYHSYSIYDKNDNKYWDESLEYYEITDLLSAEELKVYTKLPESFFIRFNQKIIDKLIELFPDLDIKDQFRRYGNNFNYIGRNADYPNFEINNRSFFKTSYNCEYLNEKQFFGCFESKSSVIEHLQQTKEALYPTEVELIAFSKITNKKQITKLFKF